MSEGTGYEVAEKGVCQEHKRDRSQCPSDDPPSDIEGDEYHGRSHDDVERFEAAEAHKPLVVVIHGVDRSCDGEG
ncbi:hypothetical protein SDC9_102858 [bioreactor metagenome]|uniref:Uncharacterized protein n=1 Tax=bioreactor metagenome TaxID=1076179 RepID=A0A645ASK9_9ZZZZ